MDFLFSLILKISLYKGIVLEKLFINAFVFFAVSECCYAYLLWQAYFLAHYSSLDAIFFVFIAGFGIVWVFGLGDEWCLNGAQLDGDILFYFLYVKFRLQV